MTERKIGEFGIKLRELRRAAGLTQSQLAQKSGVANGTIGNYEAGHRAKITADVAVKLSRALGCSVSELGIDTGIVCCQNCKHAHFAGTANPLCNKYYGAGGFGFYCADGERRDEE